MGDTEMVSSLWGFELDAYQMYRSGYELAEDKNVLGYDNWLVWIMEAEDTEAVYWRDVVMENSPDD